MSYWLMKSEPSVYSIDTLAREKTGIWDGVRNYAARNFMRAMRVGDEALFYHSNAKPAGVAGIMAISQIAFADPSQFKPGDVHFDPKSKKESPTWSAVGVSFVQAFKNVIALDDLRRVPELKGMVLFRLGRLSVQPVTPQEWKVILRLAQKA